MTSESHAAQSAPEASGDDEHRITKAVLNRMFLRSLTLEASFNYERQQGLGFAFIMAPAIRRLYRTREERAAALTRHLAFFNITPYVNQAVVGATAAMEAERKSNPSITETSVESVKVALMGPLAGIGDSLYWGTLRLIITGIAVALALGGNFVGPILFVLGFNIPVLLLSYFYLRGSFSLGTKFLSRISAEMMERITSAATMVGLLVIGGLTASLISISTPLAFPVGDGESNIQTDVLDGILPGMLPLATFWLFYWLLGKKWKPWHLLLLSLALGFIGAFTGILGVGE